jgi:hypothetical protein
MTDSATRPLAAVLTALVLSAGAVQAADPSIKIDRPAPCGGGPDQMAQIAGTTTGADPATQRVVLFAGTDVWYVQPYTAAPLTSLGRDGNWTSPSHLGQRYAALLVTSPTYKPPMTTFALPEVGSEVLAVDVVPCAGSK